MRYRLLALDLDGTLTNSHRQITPRTTDALRQAQENGVRIVLASGRPAYGIAPYADEIRLDKYGGYIFSYNGGEIISWHSKEPLYKKTLDPEILPCLYQCAKNSGFPIITFHKEFVITENPEDEYVQKEAVLSVMTLKKVSSFLQAVQFPTGKCMIAGEPSKLVNLEKEMHARLKGRVEVYRSEPYFLELVPKGTDKARSLAYLLKKLGISREETAACGDGFNDLSMIKYAGLGVAMRNAQETVRGHADYVTCSNDDDGVAHVIERFIL